LKDLSFKDWSFPLKIMAGYLSGILLLTILFSMSIRHLGTMVDDYNSLMNDTWRQLDSLQTIRSAAMDVRLNLPAKPDQARRKLAQIDFALDKYFALKRGGVPLDLLVLVADIYNFRRQANLMILGGGSLADLDKAFNSLDGRTYYEVERSRGNTEAAEGRFIERINQLLLLNVILAPLSFLFLYYYGYMLANTTGLRLKKFLADLQQIADGKPRVRIRDDSTDEVGQIAAGINKLADKIEKGYNTSS
jgi:methyl-accepting chemotaxis protein